MLKSIATMLISDSLEINNVKCNADVVDFIVEYAISDIYRVMYVDGNHLHLEDSGMKDLSENLVVGLKRIENYIEKSNKLKFVDHIIESTDVLRLSVDNGIPLSRLTGDYDSLRSLNKKYLTKLNDIFKEISSVVEFVTEHKIVTVEVNKDDAYHNIIREFIENELKT